MKKFFLTFAFIFIAISESKSEIAYIDISLILKNSDAGKSLNKYLKNINDKNLIIYRNKENELKIKEKSLIAQQNILNKDEFEKKLNVLSNEVNEYRNKKKESLEKLNKTKIEKTKEILKKLNPILTNYVELNSISILLPKKNIIVGKKNLDITDQIIKLLNNDIKKLDF